MCGLLFEVDDLVVLIGDHDAETGCFFHGDGHDCDGSGSACLLVAVEHLVVVHLVDVVTGEDKQIFRIIRIDEIDVLCDCVSGAAIDIQSCVCFLTGSQNEYAAVFGIKAPEASLCDIAVQQYGFILGQDTDNVDPTVGTVAEREIDNTVFATVSNCWLSNFVGKIMQTTSPTTGQDHS